MAKYLESLQNKRTALENAKTDKSSLMSEFSGTLVVMSKFIKYLINNNTSSVQYGVVKEFLDNLQKQIDEFSKWNFPLKTVTKYKNIPNNIFSLLKLAWVCN